MTKIKPQLSHDENFWAHDLKQSKELTPNTPSILVECECGFRCYLLPEAWKHYQRERKTKMRP